MEDIKLQGYARSEGVFGIRNHVIVVSSVVCANTIVEKIAAADEDVVMITHQHGCDHIGDDREQVLRTLAGICNNPNVGGVLLVGLGCENVSVDDIAKGVNTENRIVRKLRIHELGDLAAILDAAKASLSDIKQFVSRQEKTAFGIKDLVVGLECGASDPFSGITANPAVGKVSDRLVAEEATVMLAEVPEMIGAKDILAERIDDDAVREALFLRIDSYVDVAKRAGSDLRGINPTPGNIRAGLSTLEEKSIGAISKAGSSKIKEFVPYAGKPRSKGLVIMDTPGNDAESITGEVAGGAQVILFTTGMGTPIGSPVAPVIKIASNTKVFKHMRGFVDIDAGKVVEGVALEEVGDEVFRFLIEVCNGKETASELNGSREFSINRIGPSF
ncbi:UxaA family hydrolase [Nanoarchaeota archaeon]